MMRMVLIVFVCLSVPSILYAATIGSDTAVNRFFSQLSLGDGDRIAGFAALQGGFNFSHETAGDSVTWDSFFPLSGPLSFLGDTLILNRDLMLSDPVNFESLGNITGNDHTLGLSGTTTFIPSPNEGCTQIKFVDEVTPSADVRALDWSPNDDFVAIGLGGTSLEVYSFDGRSLTSIDSASLGDIPLSVSWHPTGNFIAVGRETNTGDEFRMFEFDGTSLTELTGNSISFSGNVTSVHWAPSGDLIVIGDISGGTGTIGVYSFDADTKALNTTPLDTISTGDVIADDAVKWNVNSDFIAVGIDVDAGNDVEVYEWNGTTLSLNASHAESSWFCKGVEWHQTSTGIIVASGQNTASTGRVFLHDASAGTISNEIQFGAGAQSPDVTVAKNGNCVVICYSSGGGANAQVFDFDPDDIAITARFFLSTGATTVNTGQWSRTGKYVALGSAIPLFTIYQNLVEFDSRSNQFTLADVYTELSADITIENAWLIFRGETTINGNGNTLTLGDNCQLIVDDESSLALTNIRINGLHDNKIRCFDSLGTVTLENAQLILDNTLTFTQGKIDIVGDVELIGDDQQWNTTADQRLSIESNSHLLLGQNVTLYYQPAGGADTLLQFTDQTSQLVFDNQATLRVSSAGLQLTNGVVRILNNATWQTDSSSSGDEIVLGDGSNSSNDMRIRLSNNTELNLSTGALSYNNVNATRIQFNNPFSHLTIGSSATLRVQQSLNTGDGYIEFADGATLARASGADIEGDIIPRGSLTNTTI